MIKIFFFNRFYIIWGFLISLSLSACQSVSLMQKKLTDHPNEMAYQVVGKGATLVLIHAGGLNQDMWSTQLQALQSDYQIITYDVRGHGQSLAKDESIPEIDDLRAILESERIAQAHILGLSFGAILALDFALAYPQKVDKLVLASPGLVGFQEQNPEFLRLISPYINAIQKNDSTEMLDRLRILTLGTTQRRLAVEIEDYVAQSLKGYLAKGSHLRIPNLKENNPVAKLNTLKMPTLIMYGTKDFSYILRNAQKLLEDIETAQAVSLEETSHLINLESPKAFNGLLLKFLKTD